MNALPPSTSNGHVHVWERQEHESGKAYGAFELYRDAGGERTLSKVAQQLHVSKALLGRWSARWGWVARSQAWDNHQSRSIHDAVLSTLIRQAQQLQKKANEVLKAINKGGEVATIPELCLMLKTVCSLAECAVGRNSNAGLNEYGFPANLPPPVFNMVMYSKPDSHYWVRHTDDPEAKEGFHVPNEIAVAIKQQFPQYFVVI